MRNKIVFEKITVLPNSNDIIYICGYIIKT